MPVPHPYERVRQTVPHLDRDAVLSDLIAAVKPLVAGLGSMMA